MQVINWRSNVQRLTYRNQVVAPLPSSAAHVGSSSGGESQERVREARAEIKLQNIQERNIIFDDIHM